MNKALTAALVASTMSLGFVAPAAAQVSLQFGNDKSDAQHRQADRIEDRGADRAERAADRGNYAKAAKIQRKSERHADKVEDRADRNSSGVTIRVD